MSDGIYLPLDRVALLGEWIIWREDLPPLRFGQMTATHLRLALALALSRANAPDA